MLAPRTYRDLATSVGELERVADAIVEALLQTSDVADEAQRAMGAARRRNELGAQLDLLRVGHPLEGVRGRLEESAHREGLAHEHEPPRVDALEVQHVGDDVLHELGARAQRPHALGALGVAQQRAGARLHLAEQAGRVAHRQQGAAQIVHHHADEPAAGRLGRLSGFELELLLRLPPGKTVSLGNRDPHRAQEVVGRVVDLRDERVDDDHDDRKRAKEAEVGYRLDKPLPLRN
mmetsp:Transcript_24070/g.62013  ORF Transcript_24070/g.62013 Transcript_24070/m.62013 type:complete len:234 (-) Transcript_24070:520-1221(-)